jgi:hypothetical protein
MSCIYFLLLIFHLLIPLAKNHESQLYSVHCGKDKEYKKESMIPFLKKRFGLLHEKDIRPKKL